MANISKNQIVTINRGDSFSFEVPLRLSEQSQETDSLTGTTIDKYSSIVYKLIETDCVYFGVMEANAPFERAVIRKKLTFNNGDFELNDTSVIIKIKPEDTLNLIPGVYYWSLKLSEQERFDGVDDEEATVEEIVTTIVPKTKFVIVE